MSADLTREQAREQVARAINPRAWTLGGVSRAFGESYEDAERRHQDWARADADAALTVLWPVVESLRADLAHAHAVIARHVEPRREGEP